MLIWKVFQTFLHSQPLWEMHYLFWRLKPGLTWVLEPRVAHVSQWEVLRSKWLFPKDYPLTGTTGCSRINQAAFFKTQIPVPCPQQFSVSIRWDPEIWNFKGVQAILMWEYQSKGSEQGLSLALMCNCFGQGYPVCKKCAYLLSSLVIMTDILMFLCSL